MHLVENNQNYALNCTTPVFNILAPYICSQVGSTTDGTTTLRYTGHII
jgi:hypothetical protein